jgi:hypothetical protein
MLKFRRPQAWTPASGRGRERRLRQCSAPGLAATFHLSFVNSVNTVEPMD